MKTIFAINTYSKESRLGECDNIHLVIFDKWINTGIKLSRKWETSLTIDPIYIGFSCRWLKPNYYSDFTNENYFLKLWKAPWSCECFEHGFYIQDKWQWYKDMNYEQQKVIEEHICDKYNTKFKYIEKDEKIEVKVLVYGEARRYAPICLPSFLKRWYCRVNNLENKEVRIKFSEELGDQKGTYKGGIVSTRHPFNISLMFSWLDFKVEKLGEILNGRRII